MAFIYLESSGAAAERWDLIARAASNRALLRERLVAFRVFRSRRGALGPYRARRIQQSLWRERLVACSDPEPPRICRVVVCCVVLCCVVLLWCAVLFCVVLCCVQDGVGGRVWAE